MDIIQGVYKHEKRTHSKNSWKTQENYEYYCFVLTSVKFLSFVDQK